MLFEPGRHEPLGHAPWDPDAARRGIEAIVRDTEDRFSSEALWPAHPLDHEGTPPEEPYTGLYLGAAGVVAALDDLARRGFARSTTRFVELLAALEQRNARELESDGWGAESYLSGRSGILLARYRLAPSREVADRLAESIAANTHHPTRELMWGAPGTMHAALTMHDWTGEERWAALYRAGARSLAASLESRGGCELWTQEIWGRRLVMLGAGHGYAGVAGALIRGFDLLQPSERATWIERIVRAIIATAQRERGLANWLPEASGAGRIKWLVHWCHGAPGMVTSLAALRDARLDAVLIAAGELVWTAGPLLKGASLCHGTAGNGYAFLKLFRRTGDERWLERARAFAMHAIAQSAAHERRYGMRRYSLYTGDLGLAIYLVHCLDGSDAWPGLDADVSIRQA
ncbi:MAG TPA: LanC-like protein [Casimicrobiaceae bacterium]|jgi:lantibiotic modifying enzyme|nr:LanC-like protein [Casimicrobiaceae bacterium]